MNLRGRAAQRGRPLDEDCYKANRTTHEYGSEDTRFFCYGVNNGFPDEIADKCLVCGAFVYNAKPLQNKQFEQRRD